MDLHIFLVEHLPKTEKFKETEDTRYIYQKEIEKKCFQYDTAYVVYEYLLRKKVSDKVLHDKVFSIPNNPRYDGHQQGIVSMA